MQTNQDSHSPIELAGSQEPLLRASQICVGVLLTGIKAEHVWQVVALDGHMVSIVMLPLSEQYDHHRRTGSGHTFATQGQGSVCVCGLRTQLVKDFLPSKPKKARFHVISIVDRPVLIPKDTALYAAIQPGNTVKIVTVLPGQGWSEPVPIVPVLHKIWEIPNSVIQAMSNRITPISLDLEAANE